jgi:hypothetical protein
MQMVVKSADLLAGFSQKLRGFWPTVCVCSVRDSALELVSFVWNDVVARLFERDRNKTDARIDPPPGNI